MKSYTILLILLFFAANSLDRDTTVEPLPQVHLAHLRRRKLSFYPGYVFVWFKSIGKKPRTISCSSSFSFSSCSIIIISSKDGTMQPQERNLDDYNEAGLECNTLIGSSNSSYNTLRVKETDEEAGFTMVWFRLLLLPTTTTTTTTMTDSFTPPPPRTMR